MATRKFAFSLRGRCSILMCLVLCTLVLFRGDRLVFAQTSPQSSDELLNAKQKRFLEYNRDFLDFVKSIPDTFEKLYASELVTVASETVDRLDAAGNFLWIYRSLSCKEDRARIKPLLENQFSFYSQYLELSIKSVNLDISHTKTPGVAVEAIRMKDDLREAKSILDSIKLR